MHPKIPNGTLREGRIKRGPFQKCRPYLSNCTSTLRAVRGIVSFVGFVFRISLAYHLNAFELHRHSKLAGPFKTSLEAVTSTGNEK